jgi:hypothetical protein
MPKVMTVEVMGIEWSTYLVIGLNMISSLSSLMTKVFSCPRYSIDEDSRGLLRELI